MLDLGVISADQYLTTLALHDEVGWHRRLRSTHEQRLACANEAEFAELARTALVPAVADAADSDDPALSAVSSATLAP